MAKHVVKIDEIKFPLVIKEELCGSYSGNSHKSLECRITINSGFENATVRYVAIGKHDPHEDAGEFDYGNLAMAIEAYNNLP